MTDKAYLQFSVKRRFANLCQFGGVLRRIQPVLRSRVCFQSEPYNPQILGEFPLLYGAARKRGVDLGVIASGGLVFFWKDWNGVNIMEPGHG